MEIAHALFPSLGYEPGWVLLSVLPLSYVEDLRNSADSFSLLFDTSIQQVMRPMLGSEIPPLHRMTWNQNNKHGILASREWGHHLGTTSVPKQIKCPGVCYSYLRNAEYLRNAMSISPYCLTCKTILSGNYCFSSSPQLLKLMRQHNFLNWEGSINAISQCFRWLRYHKAFRKHWSQCCNLVGADLGLSVLSSSPCVCLQLLIRHPALAG